MLENFGIAMAAICTLFGVFQLYNGIISSDMNQVGWCGAAFGRVGDGIPRRQKQTGVGQNPQAISRAA